MVRLGLSIVEKRIAKLEARAKRLNVPPLSIVDPSQWPDDEYRAFMDGDRDERLALVRAYLGPPVENESNVKIRALIIVPPSSDAMSAHDADYDD